MRAHLQLPTLLVVAALVTGCGDLTTHIPLLSAAGVPVTLTAGPEIPLEVVTRSTGVRDPLPVDGASVSFGDVETSLGHAISTAAVPWAQAHRAQRPEGWQLTVELTQADATYQERAPHRDDDRARHPAHPRRADVPRAVPGDVQPGGCLPAREGGSGLLHLHGTDGPRSRGMARPSRALTRRSDT